MQQGESADVPSSSATDLPPAVSCSNNKGKGRETPAAGGHTPFLVPPPAPRLNDLDDWPDVEDGTDYNIIAEDSLQGIGEGYGEELDADIFESISEIEDSDVSNVLDGLDSVVDERVAGAVAEKARDREEETDSEKEAKTGKVKCTRVQGKNEKRDGRRKGKEKEKEKKERAPRVYEEVSLDDLGIDVWDMPSPWSQYVGRNIYDVQSILAIHAGTKCQVLHMRGTIDQLEVRFIMRHWRQTKLDGFLREVRCLVANSIAAC